MSELCTQIERFGKAIGNTTRYTIVQTLARGPRTVTELVSTVGGSQSAISQHLKVLKLSNVVIDERSGQEVFYRLNTEHTLFLLKSIVGDFQKQRSGVSVPKKRKSQRV